MGILPNGNVGFAGGYNGSGPSSEFKQYPPANSDVPTTGSIGIGILILIISGLLGLSRIRKIRR